MNRKPRFDIENYIDEIVAIHCKTMKELKVFLDYLSSTDHPFPGYKEDPERIMSDMYSAYRSDLCISINFGWISITGGRLGYGPIRQYKNYDILEFSDFDWFTIYDIEDGMVVVTRKGTKYIKFNDYLVSRNCNKLPLLLADYDIDCNYRYSTDEDIVAVYSSKALHFDQGISNLLLRTSCYDNYCIWKRNDDVVKLTVEDVEKLLGYKVEIVVGKDNNL